MKKPIKTIKIIILMAVFAGLLIYALRYSGKNSTVSAISITGWSPAKDGIYADVRIGGRDETIGLWWNEKRNCYELFLPGTRDASRGIRLWSPSYARLTVDENDYEEGLFGKGETEIVLPGEIWLPDNEPCGFRIETEAGSFNVEVLTGADIPSLFLDLGDKHREALYERPYERQEGGSLRIFGKEGILHSEELDYIRVRGNTSADWNKKPYQIRLKSPSALLGMGSALRWNLLSNGSDKSLIRNKTVYDMAAEAGCEFSPKSRFTDLYINGDYQGCYQLCEKVELETDRVNIRNLEYYTTPVLNDEDRARDERIRELSKLYEMGDPSGEEELASLKADYRREYTEDGRSFRYWDVESNTEDITGGYLLELERPSRIADSTSFFVSKIGQPVTIKKPEYVSGEQMYYISGLWQEFEDALWSENGINPENGRHYTEYIDLESFAKKYLVEEIVRNYDASSTSQYFYKDSDEVDSRIKAGPVWDYDMSLGNSIMNPATNQNYISSISPYGIFAGLYMDDYTLYARLSEMEDFRSEMVRLYERDFLPVLKQLEEGRLEKSADGLRGSAVMDELRWKKYDDSEADQVLTGEVYGRAVEELVSFVQKREAYLTGLWLEGRQNVRVYLSGGDADMYVSYVENLVGEPLEEPPSPNLEGYDFLYWADGYTGEEWDFSKAYEGSGLYLAAVYADPSDGKKYAAFIDDMGGFSEID